MTGTALSKAVNGPPLMKITGSAIVSIPISCCLLCFFVPYIFTTFFHFFSLKKSCRPISQKKIISSFSKLLNPCCFLELKLFLMEYMLVQSMPSHVIMFKLYFNR